jgi:hypothetical protein
MVFLAIRGILILLVIACLTYLIYNVFIDEECSRVLALIHEGFRGLPRLPISSLGEF